MNKIYRNEKKLKLALVASVACGLFVGTGSLSAICHPDFDGCGNKKVSTFPTACGPGWQQFWDGACNGQGSSDSTDCTSNYVTKINYYKTYRVNNGQCIEVTSTETEVSINCPKHVANAECKDKPEE